MLPILEQQESYDNDSLFAALGAYASEKGYKVGKVMWPVRVALSGKQMTPGGATEIMQILGKETSLKRIGTAIAALEQAAE